jgi:DNA-binding protein H-NS
MEISLETLQNLLPSDIEKLKETLQQFEKSKERGIIKKFISDMKDIGSYDSIKDKKVSELLKTNAVVKVKGEAKYQNPDNLSQTWTGKGREPNWYKEWISSGKPLEKLEIQK